MASIAMMIGGAVVNALAFSGSNFLFSSLGGGEEERKRHDKAIEQLNEAHEAWVKRRTQRQDWEHEQLLKSQQARDNYRRGEIASATAYHATEPPTAGKEPVLGDFYTPSEEQKDREIGFIVAGTTVLGIVLYKYV